jgi:triosephosphate isomerase (TIM)
MLAGLCDYVIAGHSERRHVLGESNEIVAAKVRAILRAGISPILCVGETLEERESGAAKRVVGSQLSAAIDAFDAADLRSTVIAYEPVWAIGTGKAASEDDAQAMATFIRSWIADKYDGTVANEIPILYGGSVKGDNAAGFMACPDVDGALVGGASLDASEFTLIARAAVAHVN